MQHPHLIFLRIETVSMTDRFDLRNDIVGHFPPTVPVAGSPSSLGFGPDLHPVASFPGKQAGRLASSGPYVGGRHQLRPDFGLHL
jgi:hypothetical protein